MERGRCATHSREQEQRYEAERGTSRERGYTWTWEKARKMKLRASPLCSPCEGQGRVRAAVLVHHRDRDPANNEAANLVSMCRECHEAEHKEERWTGSRRRV